MAVTPNRRDVLQWAVVTPFVAAGSGVADAARAPVLERLIQEARPLPSVAARIDLISGKLLGIRYRSNTLIGSPKLPEQFVIRDDAFDCVTYCEAVLAAAISRDFAEFEINLRRIRYNDGVVRYDMRNHYFADWCKRNIDNGICKPVAIEPSVKFDKVLKWHSEFGDHKVSISAIEKSTMFAQQKRLSVGDVIGFVSHREGLDYFHTGFIAFSKSGDLTLRSAALSQGRVLDWKMADFIATNPVRYVTLLRPAEHASTADRR